MLNLKVANIVLNDFTNDSRVLKISKSLSDLKFNVTVVALHVDGVAKKEVIDNFSVDRISLWTKKWPKFKLLQLIKYFEFALRTFWRYRQVNFVHCNDLEALPVALLVKIFKNNVKVIYDCHEYQTETNGINGINKFLTKSLERFLIRYVDEVTTVSESIADDYVRLYSIPKPKIVLNCPAYSEQVKKNIFREVFLISKDQNIFLYQGLLGEGRGIEILLECFSDHLISENVLVCMGYGPLERQIKNKSDQCKNIFFHPAVSSSELLNYTSSADFGISFVEDTCLSYRYSLPNKFFEYTMAGLPVLTSNLLEMKLIVERESIGVVAQTNTVGGFKMALTEILQQDYSKMQSNVFEFRRNYCWEKQEVILKSLYLKS